MFFSIQHCLKFLFPAANPNWKFPMRQTRALPACFDSQISQKQPLAASSKLIALSDGTRCLNV
jgi:hypothetical protein